MGRGKRRAGKICQTQYSDWPHGSTDAAFIIAFYSIPPRFNTGRDTQRNAEETESPAGTPRRDQHQQMVPPKSAQTANRLLLTEQNALNEQRV